ncbi:MAG TPA: methionyl-tRNA formyltransferase [Candidatus Acidoferrum sp.]|jgi:methionyl-tRNA formyltransferase|nr:methionyl-tRNA formyltransferase [Candidatus Acidoferrum sp.]
MMRIVFCGTPQFAVPTLEHLLGQSEFEIIAVITQPDRPRGRGQEISFSAVKQAAISASLPVHQPEKIRDPEAQNVLARLHPDVIVIIAYGQIVPARLLAIPELGWINLHASLLPKYRGAAPINWAIVHGETKTGLTTMRIDAGMDTGDMLLQREFEIGPKETAPELALRLSEIGAPLMAETLRGLAAGALVPHRQNHGEATLAPLLKKEDGRIDWNRPAQEIYNRIRGFAPWPGAYTTFRGQTCLVWAEPVSSRVFTSQLSGTATVVAGTLVAEKNALFVFCGGTTLLGVQTVKLEGRKEVSALEFANGARLKPEERFGDI